MTRSACGRRRFACALRSGACWRSSAPSARSARSSSGPCRVGGQSREACFTRRSTCSPAARRHDLPRRAGTAAARLRVTLTAIAIGGCLLFRPLPPSRGPQARRRAARRPGSSRSTARHARVLQAPPRPADLFAPTARGFLGYRVERGVLLVAGDPVARPTALPGARPRGGRAARSCTACASRRSAPARRCCRSGARGDARALRRRRGDRRDRRASRSRAARWEGAPGRQPRSRAQATRPSSVPVELERRARPSSRPSQRAGATARRERGFTMAMDSLAASTAARVVASPATARAPSAASCTSSRLRPPAVSLS